MKTVLVTGANGLIGTRLCEMLLQKGYVVNTLGREIRNQKSEGRPNTKRFVWNIEEGRIDAAAFENVSAIIHLAGAGIAEKRWSTERKVEIADSRVKSTQLIFNFLKKNKQNVHTFISASAVGYYGDCADKVLTELHKPGTGFLADLCKHWEKAAQQFNKLNIREVRMRTGIVLAKNGGALPELTRTVPFGFASYFAKENLYYPWVHIDDVCGIMLHVLENESLHGAYNTTAPSPLLMKDLMKEILRARKSKALLVPAPPLSIQLALGEMSQMLLSSQRCSAKKILESGYKFRFGEIGNALRDVTG